MNRALELIRPRLEREGASIRVDVPAGIGVAGNPNELEQVLVNLLVNAGHAIDPGGGTIEIRAAADGGRAILTIADDGCGIADDVRDRIFEPFFTTRPRGIGTGLGLSVSYGIVADHGGEIRFESAAGEGAAFTIDLPLEGGTPAPGEVSRTPVQKKPHPS